MAVALGEVLKKRLSAALEMAPNPNVPMIKEAVAHGFYRKTSLLDVQSSLLRYFPNLAEYPKKLIITGVYNPETFQAILERLSEQGYYEVVKKAVWNNDLSVIDPTAIDRSPVRPVSGELVPPRPEIPPLPAEPPMTARVSGRTEASTNIKSAPLPKKTKEAEEPEAADKKQQAPEQPQEPEQNQDGEQQQRGPEDKNQPEEQHEQSQQQSAQSQPQQRPNLRDRFRRRRSPRRILPGQERQAANLARNPTRWRDALRRGERLANRLGYNRLGNALGRLASPERALGNLARSGLRNGLNGLRGGGQILPRVGSQIVGGVARGVGAIIAAIGIPGLIIIGVIFVIVGLFILVLWLDQIKGNSECDKPNGTMSVEKRSGGGESVNNGDKIDFVIIVNYDLACRTRTLSQVEVTDIIPPGFEYVKDSAKAGYYTSDQTGSGSIYNDTTRTLTWTFKDFPMGSPVYIYFSIEPTKKDDGSWSVQDAWVMNEASVKYTGSGGVISGGSLIDPTTLTDADFDTLMRGQGRNLLVMGNSEEEFMAKLKSNLTGTFLERLVTFEDQKVRQIYRTCIEKQVNPLVCLTVWGTESWWTENNGLQFGCDPHSAIRWNPDGSPPRGFDQQLECASNTWKNNMAKFKGLDQDGDGKVQLPSDKGLTCIYDEEFLFAAELYGPICATSDGNSGWRKSFTEKYKLLLGVK